jgi:hypothetical protein
MLITHDEISWRSVVSFRLPKDIVISIGREWRGNGERSRQDQEGHEETSTKISEGKTG